MRIRTSVADLLTGWLAVEQPIGIMPPGSNVSLRCSVRDGEITLFGNGDSLTLVIGKHSFTLVRLTPEIAVRLGWFLIWRWWVRGTWCGAKLALWYWAIGVKLDDAMRERKNARQT